MRIREVPVLEDRAEGTCCGLPYNTELVSSAGCSIHFWVGDTCDKELLERALHVARGNRDIVCAQWSYGAPTKFWAHADMGKA